MGIHNSGPNSSGLVQQLIRHNSARPRRVGQVILSELAVREIQPCGLSRQLSTGRGISSIGWPHRDGKQVRGFPRFHISEKETADSLALQVAKDPE